MTNAAEFSFNIRLDPKEITIPASATFAGAEGFTQIWVEYPEKSMGAAFNVIFQVEWMDPAWLSLEYWGDASGRTLVPQKMTLYDGSSLEEGHQLQLSGGEKKYLRLGIRLPKSYVHNEYPSWPVWYPYRVSAIPVGRNGLVHENEAVTTIGTFVVRQPAAAFGFDFALERSDLKKSSGEYILSLTNNSTENVNLNLNPAIKNGENAKAARFQFDTGRTINLPSYQQRNVKLTLLPKRFDFQGWRVKQIKSIEFEVSADPDREGFERKVVSAMWNKPE